MNQNRKRKSPQISTPAPQNPKIAPRMDFEKSKSCLNLLKTLMGHSFGWVFNQPVDPVKLQIPDYFIIISCPMDLGTVRDKLIKKKYLNVGQFCDDVRLTFSNAMVYNPPGNDVHNMAKELNKIFEKGWKSLEEKWNPNLGQGNPNLGMNGNPNLGNGNPNLERGDEKRRRENPNLGMDGNPNLGNGNPNLERGDEKRRRENPNLGNGNPNLKRENPNLGNGNANLKRENPNLERIVERNRKENSSYERENPNLSKRAKFVEEAKPAEIVRKNGHVSGRASYKAENSNGHSAFGAKTEKSSYYRESSNGHTAPDYNGQSISKRENGNGCTGSSVRPEPKYAERSNGMPQTSASCKTDVSVSARKNIIRISINGRKVSNENGCSASQPSSAPQCSKNEVKEEEIQMSPEKALRVAMMKKRFAGTIIKAQEKILLDQGKKVDPAKLKLEREKLERGHLEEEARIEAAQKAAHEKREQERAAARLEIQQMKQTVETYDSELMWYIEKMQRSSHYFNMESIGLYRKSFSDENYDSDKEELEEGEIL
ncbi:hypothetical protein LUZ60_010806 [Juncus effusus]|nr:hypothetical protein LUZ60_010806 [Juncus effusus]